MLVAQVISFAPLVSMEPEMTPLVSTESEMTITGTYITRRLTVNLVVPFKYLYILNAQPDPCSSLQLPPPFFFVIFILFRCLKDGHETHLVLLFAFSLAVGAKCCGGEPSGGSPCTLFSVLKDA